MIPQVIKRGEDDTKCPALGHAKGSSGTFSKKDTEHFSLFFNHSGHRFAMINTLKSACQEVKPARNRRRPRTYQNIGLYVPAFFTFFLQRAQKAENVIVDAPAGCGREIVVDRSCFAAPFGELVLSPWGNCSRCACWHSARQSQFVRCRPGSQTEAPPPAGAADCPKTARPPETGGLRPSAP